MSGLLRSVIDYDGGLSQENLSANYAKLKAAQIEWPRPDDKKIWDFVQSYFLSHLETPQKATLLDFFERQKDVETVDRIKVLEKIPPYIRTNYSHLLTTVLEEQNKIKAITLFKEAQEIAAKGLIIEGEKVQGVRAAISHFTSNASALIAPEHNSKLRGNLRQDGQAVWDEYELAKVNKDLVWGKFCGLNEIDKVCHGIKRGELWVHAAFAGELKTTFSTNWAYNLVTRYRTNVFYVSLEMTYEHIRRLIYVIHSTNLKWKIMGYKPLDYRKVRDGELTPEEEIFFKMVIHDFNNNEEYGSFGVWRPDDDISTDDIKMEAELEHKQNEIGLLVIDHGGLLEPRKKRQNKDYVVALNSVIRDTKKLALNFNHGEAVAILMLFQINRQGKEEADKADGIYKLKALAYANECERSADVVSTTYLNDQLRLDKKTKFANLKNRDNPLFDPFEAAIDFGSRRLVNLDAFSGNQGRGMALEDNRTLADVMQAI